MTVLQKINFWVFKISRLAYYQVRFRVNKWTEIEGVQFPVHLEYGYDVLRFIANGEYESGEIEIISNTLKEGDRVLELGTGLGFISTYCAKRTGSQNVYTFEANPFLEKNIRELYNKNKVQPNLEFAILGKEKGITVFQRNTASLLASGIESKDVVNSQSIEVPLKSLNETIASINPTYLVMDIEGGEYEIFKEIDFQTITKIQFELHPEILGDARVGEIFSKLGAHHFIRDASFTKPNNFYFFKEAGADK